MLKAQPLRLKELASVWFCVQNVTRDKTLGLNRWQDHNLGSQKLFFQ